MPGEADQKEEELRRALNTWSDHHLKKFQPKYSHKCTHMHDGDPSFHIFLLFLLPLRMKSWSFVFVRVSAALGFSDRFSHGMIDTCVCVCVDFPFLLLPFPILCHFVFSIYHVVNPFLDYCYDISIL